MFRNYFVTAMRSIRKQRVHSLINILGLALGMSCTILIILWVQDELSFDRFHGNFGRLYRVVADWPKNGWNGVNASPMPLGPAVEEGIPESVATVRFAGQPRRVFRYGDKAFYEDRGIIADASLFTVFTFQFVKGNPAGVFGKASDMVITESTARKYFGDEDPIGKIVEVEGRPATVTGVVTDSPSNSTLQFDFINGFEFIEELSNYGTHWGALNFDTYILLRPDADPAETGPKITEIAANHNSPHVKAGLSFRLQPLSGVHLDARPYTRNTVLLGDRKYVYLFSVIAAFVLLIACVNFMNLSTARASIRAKEVGLRKTIGAGRGQLVRQFLGETFLLSLIAFMVSLGCVLVLLPAFNQLTGKAIRFDLTQGGQILGLVAVVLVTGLVAGVYPALFLSGLRPASMMKGTGGNDGLGGGLAGRGAVLRRALVVFQFVLSMILIIVTLVVYKQIRFIQKTDLGFDRENVVQLPLKGNIARQYAAFKTRLLDVPQVVAVSAESYPFAELTNRSAGNWDWEGRDGRENLDLVYGGVDYDFAETLDLRTAAGRTFSPEYGTDKDGAIVINESAAQAMGLEEPVGKWFAFSREKPERRIIVGVIEDAHFRSFHHGIEPMFFYLSDLKDSEDMGIILVRVRSAADNGRAARKGGLPETMAAIRSVWEEFNPYVPFEYTFLDQTYNNLYLREGRAVRLFNIFAGLAVAISCLGLFGLAAFMAERRTKEIGVRKVLGAGEWGIAVLLAKDFMRWVLAANVIAAPVGYFAARKLLEVYAYRTEIGLEVFVAEGAATLGVAMLTVSRQAFRAARANPVESLRYE